MKRCFCLLFMLAAVSLTDAQGSSALMAADLSGNETPAVTAPGGEDQPSAKQIDNERGAVSERKTRKGIGADFWGGPYWGYGPRWGHPCEACRASCESDSEGVRCERCRVRCGW